MEQDKNKETIEYYKKIGIKAIIIVISLLCMFVTYKLAIFYIPFIIAYLISKVLEPVIKFFIKKIKLNRKVATIISIILLLLTIGTLITGTIISLTNEVTEIISNMNIDSNKIEKFTNEIIKFIEVNVDSQVLSGIEKSISSLIENLKDIIITVFTSILNFLTSIPTMLIYIVITFLATIFMCFDKEYVHEIIEKHIPKTFIKKLKYILKETCGVAFNYIKAEVKLSFVCFVLVLICFWVMKFFNIGMQYPTTLAIITGIVDVIPLLGAGIVMIPFAIYNIVLGYTTLGVGIIIAWGIWCIIKQLIEPKVVSKQMGVNPIFTLIAMYTGFKLLGVLGLMIGPIALLILKNIFRSTIDKGVLKSFFELE